MADAALGTRRRCAACGAPFYDLRRTSISCPKCDAPFVPEPPAPRRPARAARFRPAAARAPEPAPTPEPEAGEEDAVLDPDVDDEAAEAEEVESTDAADGPGKPE